MTDIAGLVKRLRDRKIAGSEHADALCVTAADALEVMAAPGVVLVPSEPTEQMWGGMARDIVMWTRFGGPPTGIGLHNHLRALGRKIPEWLIAEIPNTNQTPPKGTVAACIYKAMIEAALTADNGECP